MVAQMLRMMQLLSRIEEGENLGGSPTLPARPWGNPSLGSKPAPPAGVCPVLWLCFCSFQDLCFCTEQRSGLKLLSCRGSPGRVTAGEHDCSCLRRAAVAKSNVLETKLQGCPI